MVEIGKLTEKISDRNAAREQIVAYIQEEIQICAENKRNSAKGVEGVFIRWGEARRRLLADFTATLQADRPPLLTRELRGPWEALWLEGDRSAHMHRADLRHLTYSSRFNHLRPSHWSRPSFTWPLSLPPKAGLPPADMCYSPGTQAMGSRTGG